MTLSVFHIRVEQFWPFLLDATLLKFVDISLCTARLRQNRNLFAVWTMTGPLQQYDFFLFQLFFVDLLPFFETLSCCTAILVGQIASHLTTACFDIRVQSFSNCIVTSLTLNILAEVCRVFDVALGFFAMSVSISQSDLGVKLLRISTPG